MFSQQFSLALLESSLWLLSSKVPCRLTRFWYGTILRWNRQPAQGTYYVSPALTRCASPGMVLNPLACYWIYINHFHTVQLLLGKSRSYGVVPNSCAAFWRRLFQTWIFRRFVCLMYTPDGTDVYGSRGREFEEIGLVYGVESCKIVFL